MNRYTLPASIAATAHAVLFFAFPPNPVGKTPSPVAAPPALIDYVVTPPLEDPPVPEESRATSAPVPRTMAPPGPPSAPITPPDTASFERTWEPVRQVTYVGPVVPPGPPEGFGPATGLGVPSIVDSGWLDRTPRTTNQVAPIYPHSQKNLGLSGEVLVSFVVDEHGRVRDPVAIEATNREFADAALRAVTRWRFEPGKRNGMPVRFRMSLPIRFKVGEEGSAI